ncbi:hypothetical protein DRO54_10570 [Candidatus Bathyarchaeota archaeon]|nr:MAG: hypothetical protein DRO54_10570 [Candidatus Bathyarchaeota archaeon]
MEELRDENGQLIAVVMPLQGKILIEDLGNMLRVAETTMKKIVKQRGIKHSYIGQKWVVDLEDFWSKTERV